MKRFALLISVLILMLTGCNKEEQLDFDFNQVAGDYTVNFWFADSSYSLKREGVITVNRIDESTFWFSLDSLTSDSFPIFEIKLTPTQYKDIEHSAYFELINNTMFYQNGGASGPINFFSYYSGGNSLGQEATFMLSVAIEGKPKSQIQMDGKR
jgi:hypothetical protein